MGNCSRWSAPISHTGSRRAAPLPATMIRRTYGKPSAGVRPPAVFSSPGEGAPSAGGTAGPDGRMGAALPSMHGPASSPHGVGVDVSVLQKSIKVTQKARRGAGGAATHDFLSPSPQRDRCRMPARVCPLRLCVCARGLGVRVCMHCLLQACVRASVLLCALCICAPCHQPPRCVLPWHRARLGQHHAVQR